MTDFQVLYEILQGKYCKAVISIFSFTESLHSLEVFELTSINTVSVHTIIESSLDCLIQCNILQSIYIKRMKFEMETAYCISSWQNLGLRDARTDTEQFC